jgi:hypothetical protein
MEPDAEFFKLYCRWVKCGFMKTKTKKNIALATFSGVKIVSIAAVNI